MHGALCTENAGHHRKKPTNKKEGASSFKVEVVEPRTNVKATIGLSSEGTGEDGVDSREIKGSNESQVLKGKRQARERWLGPVDETDLR